jgi:tol-pal system protein YbgF
LGLLCAAALLAGCATTPPDKDPVQIKLKDLDERLSRIERVLANQSLLDLANQLEAARSDVRSLHNDVDLINNNLAIGRKQERDLYADLDRRLKVLESRGVAAAGAAVESAGGAGARAAGAGATGGVSASGAAAGTGAVGGASTDAAEVGGSATAAGSAGLPVPGGTDKANYQAAFDLLKDSKYDPAIVAFQQFLVAFPDSSLADNAQYWLGEAYYVNRNFTTALAAFQAVIDRYPESRKVPDALLKIGYCDYELKQFDLATQVLTDVFARFPDTPAGNLAKQRLDKIEADKH